MNKLALLFFLVVAVASIVALTFGLTGVILYCIWEFAARAAFPGLPYLAWWQLGLLAIGISWLGNLIRGKNILDSDQ